LLEQLEHILNKKDVLSFDQTITHNGYIIENQSIMSKMKVYEDNENFDSFDASSGSDNQFGDCKKQENAFPIITNSKTDDWIACELKDNVLHQDEFGRGYHKFSGLDTKDYDVVSPFFDYLERNDPERLKSILKEHEKNQSEDNPKKPWESCQYCGHGMRHVFRIKNDARKLVMNIGADCIEYFDNVDAGAEIRAKNTEKMYRDGLQEWKDITVDIIWKRDDFAKEHRYYQGKVRPILFANYYKFQHLLKVLHVDSLTLKEIRAIFKKAQKMNIPIPPSIEENIESMKRPRTPEPISDSIKNELKDVIDSKSKPRMSGLDEFFFS